MTKQTAHQLLEAVNSVFGLDAVRMGSHKSLVVETFPTGLLPFDILLQGGIPRGRTIEIYGDWSTLKSYFGLCAAASVQRLGGVAVVIDTEHAFEPEWAKSIGVDVDKLIVWPDRDDGEIHTGEEAFDVSQTLIAGGVDLIVFDSVAAALPQAESNKRLHKESIQPARLAQLMSTGLRRLTATNSRTAIIFVNQTRMNIGVTFGSNEALPGGKALPFYASYRISVRKVGKITKDVKYFDGAKWVGGKEQIGQSFRAEVVKSKLSKPFRDVWFQWNLEKGQIDLPLFIVSQGVESGIVTIKGNTWSHKQWKAIGREKFANLVAKTPALLRSIEEEVRGQNGLEGGPTTPVSSGRALQKATGMAASTSTEKKLVRTFLRGKKSIVKKSR